MTKSQKIVFSLQHKERKTTKNGVFIGQMKIMKKQSEYFERTNASLLQRETKRCINKSQKLKEL
jgi:hypothetical protein